MNASNPYEDSARAEKVDKLARASLAMVKRTHDEWGPSVFDTLRSPSFVLWWKGTAELAGVKTPSEVTIGLTVTLLEELIDAMKQADDPFDIAPVRETRSWA